VNPDRLKIMERWNVAFAALASLIAALAAPWLMWGVVAGGILACANFYAIRRIWQSLLSSSTQKRQAMQGLFIVKSLLLAGVVVAALALLPISPIGFAIGVSVFIPSIIVETARYALGGPTTKTVKS
jgi:hypothetical protein